MRDPNMSPTAGKRNPKFRLSLSYAIKSMQHTVILRESRLDLWIAGISPVESEPEGDSIYRPYESKSVG
jgi:hypothetical protein